MAVRMSDIARRVGVSRSTVSRVLAGKAAEFRIAPQTAARILEVAESLGYRPSQIARSLRTASTGNIALLLSDISNAFFMNIAWSVEQAAHELGFVTMIGSSGEDIAREMEYIGGLRSRGADGLLLTPCGNSFEHLRRLQEEDYPFVLLDRIFDEFPCDSVSVDNVGAAKRLTETLISWGARRIAYMGGRMETSTGRGRLEGYRAGLRAHGIPFDTSLVFRGDFSAQSGRITAKQMLRLPEPPEGVFCANNKVLAGCVEMLTEAPEDPWARLPMAAFDEVPMLKLLRRPLVIAAQPEREIGQRGFEILLKRLRDQREFIGGSGRAGGTGEFKYVREVLPVEIKVIAGPTEAGRSR